MTIAFRITEVASIDSTNTALRERAALPVEEGGEPEGFVLRADHQTAARGRRGRSWDAPEGNLYFSVLLRPDCLPAEAATVGFVSAVALGRVLRDLTPAEVLHKWPNDLLVGGAKLSGTLLEVGTRPDGRLDWLVLGIGVNIRAHPEIPGYRTTDLVASGGPSIMPQELLTRFLAVFGPFYDAWEQGGFQAIRADWMAFAAGVGQRVVARLEREEVAGSFTDLDPDGALIMQLESGQQRRIAAADIFFPNL
jgi:BirA family biotin operon repressor/biotin-[acetyl-CoA-carboxylase] ligase